MNTIFESMKSENQGQHTYDVPVHWVTNLTRVLTAEITSIVALAITVVVALLVVLGGLALAYHYLPTTIFNIIALVIVADILLGIAVRAVRNRNKQ